MLLLVGLIAPYISAAAFRDSIQNALEASLGRKVTAEKVHFTLFSGPGFSLENVTIQEDPRFGLEPFAFIPTLQTRVRLDRLLLGEIRLLSLRLVEPSLNLVKQSDGSWNVVELLERLSAPRHTPFGFFPAVEVSNGRIDLKFGTRKTTLYLTETDLSIYPERSGKVYMQFQGSPARTDRSGNGFGHLRGAANWYVTPASPAANQLEASITLDPSNLSELTTLVQGHDIGVHGTVSSEARIEGPAAALRVSGEMRLKDVHRWDLLPASGDDWRIRYQGTIDLHSHNLNLRTLPYSNAEKVPVSLQVRVNDFLGHPAWSVLATLKKAPIAGLLPLSKRMGMGLPPGLQMEGSLDGAVGYTDAAGLEGGVAITNAVATLPNIPPLRSALANVRISGGTVHIDPAILQASVGGTVRAGGDYSLLTQRLVATISADEFPITSFKNTTNAWFGSPAALEAISEGYITGQFTYNWTGQIVDHTVDKERAGQPSAWSGQFQFLSATLDPPGIALALKHAQGRATFDAGNFDLPRFTATLDQQPFSGSYHYNVAAKHPERLHLDFPAADLSLLEAALDPSLRDQSLLSRIPFTKRTIPAWLSTRNLEGELSIGRFSVDQVNLGALASHFVWQGTSLQLSAMQVRMAAGQLQGTGDIGLAAHSPRYRFAWKANGIPWSGGKVAADGEVQGSGTAPADLQSLHASGSFSGEEITLQGTDSFSKMSGLFDFSFVDEAPLLKLTGIQAYQNDDEWVGEATSKKDGKLYLDLGSGDRQIHVVSEIISPIAPVPLASQINPH